MSQHLHLDHNRLTKTLLFLLDLTNHLTLQMKMKIRFRTMGDATITGAVESDADTMEKIIEEVAAARQTERGNRTLLQLLYFFPMLLFSIQS